MTAFWIRFREFPSIFSFVLAILMMAKSRREVSRLCNLVKNRVELTTGDKRDMEDNWANFFKRHRPGASWVAGESSDATILFNVLPNIPDRELTAYYLDRAMSHFLIAPPIDLGGEDAEERSACFIMNMDGIVPPPILWLNGFNILPPGIVVLRGGAGKPEVLQTAFALPILKFRSFVEAEHFLARLGRPNAAHTDRLESERPILSLNFDFVGKELDELLSELEEVPPGHYQHRNYHMKTPSFYRVLFSLLAARGLVFDANPPERLSRPSRVEG